jgi:hypothetical protein
MLYMGSVNRVIFWVIIPCVLMFYIAYRVVEWQVYEGGQLKLITVQHAINLRDRDDIDCLILGGSNAVFSLSAEQISNQSNLTCYNLSLLNEGFSDEAYFDFIRNLPVERTQIKSIIYSSVYPLSNKTFLQRLEYNQRQTGISGDNNFQFTGRSLASFLKDFLQGKPLMHNWQYPIPTPSGDFNFDKYDGCQQDEIRDTFTPVTIDEDLKHWIRDNLMIASILFANANITFVLPSTLRNQVNEDAFPKFSDTLESEVVSTSSNFIAQSSFSDVSVLCDREHHANAEGREIRTSELLVLMQNP